MRVITGSNRTDKPTEANQEKKIGTTKLYYKGKKKNNYGGLSNLKGNKKVESAPLHQ